MSYDREEFNAAYQDVLSAKVLTIGGEDPSGSVRISVNVDNGNFTEWPYDQEVASTDEFIAYSKSEVVRSALKEKQAAAEKASTDRKKEEEAALIQKVKDSLKSDDEER